MKLLRLCLLNYLVKETKKEKINGVVDKQQNMGRVDNRLYTSDHLTCSAAPRRYNCLKTPEKVGKEFHPFTT